MPEVYASDCCGALFVPGHGPDNLLDAESNEGDEIVLNRKKTPHAPRTYEARVAKVTPGISEVHDAIRAGECPCCGYESPYLDEVTLR